MRNLSALLLSAALACGPLPELSSINCDGGQPQPVNQATPTTPKQIVSSDPSYIPYGVSLALSTLEGQAHRLQISAEGEPFDHSVYPEEFHFYTYVGGLYTDLPSLKFSGCNTRNSDSLLCDIDVYPEAVLQVYDLCFRSRLVKYTPDPKWNGPGGAATDICLKSAIFLEL